MEGYAGGDRELLPCSFFLGVTRPLVFHKTISFMSSSGSSSSRVCKLESTFKSLQRNTTAMADSGKSNQARRLEYILKLNGAGDAKRRKEEEQQERAEKLMHLICWGPN
ncbi:hypothetical protein ACLOJK_039793 [Asimina triloba]